MRPLMSGETMNARVCIYGFTSSITDPPLEKPKCLGDQGVITDLPHRISFYLNTWKLYTLCSQ